MLQTAQTDSKSILSEFLQQQVVIFGIQVLRAQLSNMKGLTFDSGGVVTSFEGDAQATLQEVASRLSVLSEYAVKHTLASIITQHTNAAPIEADLSQLPKVEENIINSIPTGTNPQKPS